MLRKYIQQLFLVVVACLLISACSSIQVNQANKPLPIENTRWVQLPLMNLAESPRATERAEALIDTQVRALGIKQLVSYREHEPVQQQETLLTLNDTLKYQSALKQARQHGYTLGIRGSVDEWRYKNGLDGEPAVGLTLQVIDIQTNQVLWSASGNKTGWGYANVTGTATNLITKLLDTMPLARK